MEYVFDLLDSIQRLSTAFTANDVMTYVSSDLQ